MGKDKVSKPWYVFTQYSPLPTSTFTNGGMLGGGAALVVVCATVVVVGAKVVLVISDDVDEVVGKLIVTLLDGHGIVKYSALPGNVTCLKQL